MNRENPYDPPKSALDAEDAAEQLRARKRQRRPLSHKCVLLFFGVYAVGCFATLAGMEVSPSFLGVLLGVCAIPVISVIGIVGFRLSKFTYFFTSASLLLLLTTTIMWIRKLLETRGDSALAEHTGAILGSAIGVVLLVLLLWRYTFGAPSRAYYGFTVAQSAAVLPKSIPPKGSGRSRSGAEEHLDY